MDAGCDTQQQHALHTIPGFHGPHPGIQLGTYVSHQASDEDLQALQQLAVPWAMVTVGDPAAYDFPRPMRGRGLDFSFSGLKTAVARHVRQRRATGSGPLSETELADICASFQRAVVDALLDRAFEAARRFGARSLGIAGGVSANSRLREVATARGAERGLPVLLPTLHLSTDNAAMIAAAGLRRLRAGVTASLDLNADAGLTL